MIDRFGWSALSFPSYRIFLLSAGIANAGLFMYATLTGWAALVVSGSSAGVGLVYSAYALPTLLVTAHAGGIADGLGARRTFGISVAAMGLVMAAVGVAALLDVLTLPIFVVLSLVVGTVTALGLPASQTIVAELVPASSVPGAVSLNFVQFATAKIIGGLIAALALATVSLGAGFIVAGMITASCAIPLYRLTSSYAPGRQERVLTDIGEAFRHARARPVLAAIIALGLVPGVVGFTYFIILPAAARDVLDVGPEGLGTLLAVSGIGGLAAGLTLQPILRRVGHGRMLILGLAGMGGSIALLGLAPNPFVAGIALVIIGAAFVVYPSATITLITAMAPAALRGRLVGFFTLGYWGALPVGGVAAGLLAEAIGPRAALVTAGVLTALPGLAIMVVLPAVVSLRVSRLGLLDDGDASAPR
jgi:MFS family permease